MGMKVTRKALKEMEARGIVAAGPPVKAKYHNQKTTRPNPAGGEPLKFDSKKEARRFDELTLLQREGEIDRLKTQVPFPLVVNGQKITVYWADFTYFDTQGRFHVEDTKSEITRKHPRYRLKAKLFKAVMGYAIEEV